MNPLTRIRGREYYIISGKYFMGNRWSIQSYVKQSELNGEIYRVFDDILDSQSEPKFITQRYPRYVSKKGQYPMKCEP